MVDPEWGSAPYLLQSSTGLISAASRGSSFWNHSLYKCNYHETGRSPHTVPVTMTTFLFLSIKHSTTPHSLSKIILNLNSEK